MWSPQVGAEIKGAFSMSKTKFNPLVISGCCNLMMASLVGPGEFRMVLLAIAAVLGIVLAIRTLA